MAEECPKCGCLVTSIRLADHVKGCTALRILPGRGTPVRPRRAVRSTTAELEFRRVAEYYQQLWSTENRGLGAILSQSRRKPKPRTTRNTGRSSSPVLVAATSGQRGENDARAKEIAAMKARIAELEAILRNRSRS